MLTGIHPLLTGELLLHLDRMGHSDAVVITDAHFPVWALGQRIIDLPGSTSPEVTQAICTVLPLDDVPALTLMTSASGEVLQVQQELMAATSYELSNTEFVDRFAYYDLVRSAYLVVRTGEKRKYANALLRKGIVA